MYRIRIFEIRPEPGVAGYLPANPAGSGYSIALHADDLICVVVTHCNA